MDQIFSALTGRDIWMISTVILCTLFIFDDVFVDLLAILRGKKARKLNADDLKIMANLPQAKVSILIANWQEEEIIERVVSGNINGLQYNNYEIILGVYPNDTGTLQAARRVEKKFKNVTVVVNTLNGPTSKGQMLNVMVNYVKSQNDANSVNPSDIILIQDSEDVIHPLSLRLINMYMHEGIDFLQIPVFSLEIPVSKLTAGIYIDEFIESHMKDLLVRDHYNAGIPSAGVGTAMKWSAIEKLLKFQDGAFLNENTLTEDYHLGLTCHDLKMKSHFACDLYEKTNEKTGKTKNEYIATREFFPQKMGQSIRQKTRWSLGISLQGFEHRKWKSAHAFETYFLWRDRKGLINAPLFTMAFIFTFYMCSTYLTTGEWPSLDSTEAQSVFVSLMWANLIASIFRIVNRMRLVNNVYGFKMASLVPIRWFLSNFINTLSTYNAIYQWGSAKIKGELPKWSKTEHMIPLGFGLENKEILENNEVPAQQKENNENNSTLNT